MSCECGEQFCYKCGKPAVEFTGHWGGEVWQCAQYPTKLSPAQKAAELLSPQDRANLIRKVLLNRAWKYRNELPLGLFDDPIDLAAVARALHDRNQPATLAREAQESAPPGMMWTVLHGLQPVGPFPNPDITNHDQINPPPERDFVREREDAEQAHDDALRAAERLADLGF
jgi:hypothetical protein